MNIPYFRGSYNPDVDDTQSSGGLLALLQAAMQRSAAAGIDPTATSNGAGGYAFPDVGMLARPVSLRGAQDVNPPAGANPAPTQSPSAGSDFRQVSRAPIKLRAQGVLNASSQASDGLGLSFNQDGAGAPDSLGPGANDNGRQASKGNASSPNVKMAQVVLPEPLPFPIPLGGGGGSGSLPQIPTPPIPDSLRALWAIYQLQRRALSGGGGGGNDNYNRCIRAVDGDTDDWENFCRSLPASNKSLREGCWKATYEPREDKLGWCQEQFGRND